jgi:hypothetical protein
MDKEKDILRDKLSNFAQEPSRDLWPGIEAEIKPKTRKPLWLWMKSPLGLAALAAALILLFALMLWPDNQAKKPSQLVEEQLPTVENRDTAHAKPKALPLEQSLSGADKPQPATEESASGAEARKTDMSFDQNETRKKQVSNLSAPKSTQRPKAAQPVYPDKKDLNLTDVRPQVTPQRAIDQQTVIKPQKALFASDIKPVDEAKTMLAETRDLRPKKVIIIRRSKPKAEQASKSYELNIGNFNLLRIKRKRSTTKVST